MRCKFHSGLFSLRLRSCPTFLVSPFPASISILFIFLLLVFFIYDRLCPSFWEIISRESTLSVSSTTPDKIIAIASLRRTRFFAVRRDFHKGELGQSQCRWGLVANAIVEKSVRADGAEKKKPGNGGTSELINSDELLPTHLFKWQYAVTFVIEERLPSRFWNRE